MQENHSSDKIIELSNCNIWQQDHLVLTDVSLDVRKGEFLYLVGKVGSGKTSLIKTLNVQLPLKEGTGMVAGYNLSEIRPKEIPYLRRKIGIVFPGLPAADRQNGKRKPGIRPESYGLEKQGRH